MRVRKGSLVFLLVFSMLVCLLAFPVSAAAGDRVLLIQSELPWGLNANNNALEQLKNVGKISGYDVRNFTDAGNAAFDLTVYKVVIIADDQSQSSYDQYNDAFKSKLETYATAGGVVLFGACQGGYNGGNIVTALPGGTTLTANSERYNYIADNTNPVVTAALSDNLALTDSNLVGSSCSHISFVESSLPAGTNVILRAKSTNSPTLAEYPLGSGHVITSGLTWEYYYSHGGSFAAKALDDLFLYALLLGNASQAAPSGLLGAAPLAYGGTDGKITGTTAAMEYKLSADSVYTPAAGTEITGLAPGIYDVRYAAKEGFDAGADAVVTVAAGPNASQSAPVGLLGIAPLTYGGTDGKITGTTAAMEYKLSADSVYTPAAATEITGLEAGKYDVRYAAKEGFDAGTDAVVIVAAGPNASQEAPIGLLGVAPSVYGAADGKITGTTAAMEYKLSADSVYTPAAATSITGLEAGIYAVRYAAKEGFDTGADALVIVAAGPNASQTAPAGLLGIAPLTYGASDGRITGTTPAMEFKLVSAEGNTPAAVSGYITVTGTEITGLAAGTYSVRYAAKVGFDTGADIVVTVPVGPNANQAAPAGLAVAPSAAGGSTGKITGTTPAMEYKLSTSLIYKAVTGTEITGLSAGIYDVRYAAKEGYNAGAAATVIVSDVLAASIATSTPAVLSAAAPAAIAATGEHDNNVITGILLIAAAGSTLSIMVRRARKSDVR